MRTHAFIRSRPVRVTGGPHSGGRVASNDEQASARLVPFDFDITDDGSGEFLLAYHSPDRTYEGDSSCSTLEDALRTAERQFGVSRSEWSFR
jgi:hypothetical protein